MPDPTTFQNSRAGTFGCGATITDHLIAGNLPPLMVRTMPGGSGEGMVTVAERNAGEHT